MGSFENGGGQHPAPEGRKIGTPPPPLDVFDSFPKFKKNIQNSKLVNTCKNKIHKNLPNAGKGEGSN